MNPCVKGQGNKANAFVRAFLQPSRGSGSTQGLFWPSFTTQIVVESSCRIYVHQDITALKANELPSHADPALASLLLLRTSCLASAQQWFHCCLLNRLPCSSFSSLHLHRQRTEQDLAMKPEGEAARPFSSLDFRPDLHQILCAKMAPRLAAPEFRISWSYGRTI